MPQSAGGALILDLRRAEVDERRDEHDVGRVRRDELADRRILRHVAFELAQQRRRAARRAGSPIQRTIRPQRDEDGRRPIARTFAQRQRLIEDAMLVAQVVEAQAQMIRDPGIVVGRARRARRRR